MEFEFNNQYVAKDQFGFKISCKHHFIIIHLEIYDENKRKEIINKFRGLADYLLKENKEKGIKRVFIVDAKDIKRQLSSSKNMVEKRKDFVVETMDLLTNEYVPLISKIIENETEEDINGSNP